MSETDNLPGSDDGQIGPPPEPAPQPAIEVAVDDPFPEVALLSAERLPPNFRKHVDPKSPVPLRGMAAKGLVPLSPSDMAHCLAMLALDADQGIVASAKKTAAGLPDKILSVALRDEGQSPRVLHFFAEMLAGKDAPLEYLALNNTAADKTVALIAEGTTSPKLLEIISNNQLRILREERVLRAVINNPNNSKAIVDLTCDFAIRSGLVLADLPAMIEAHVRIHGAPPAAPESQEAQVAAENSAEALIQEFGEALTDQAAPPMEDGKRLTLTQRVSKMTISEKIKLATLGNREARGILSRDSNKLVALAVINSPRITDGEVFAYAHSRTCPEDVLRVIMNKREWTRQYRIRHALVQNPKVPLAIALRFLITMRQSEIRDFAGDKNVPSVIRVQAKKMLEKKQ